MCLESVEKTMGKLGVKITSREVIVSKHYPTDSSKILDEIIFFCFSIGAFNISKTCFNCSLDGLTPRRSHVRRGDHMYPRAITSCPGHALCLTWQVKCTCSGDHIRAWCQELQYHAKHFNSRHQARM